MPVLPDLSKATKIGFIVPSSNSAVEPITQAIFESYGEANIIPLFTRLRVRTVGTDAASTSQFSAEAITGAASLLADAKVATVVWNGTSGQWNGGTLQDEHELAGAMFDEIGRECSTTTMAMVAALKAHAVKKVSIAVPYSEELAAKAAKFYSNEGYEVLTTQRLEPTPKNNIEIAKSTSEDIKDVIRRCAVPGCEAILVSCTNWPATALVEELEKELDVMIIDSISATAWWPMLMIGCKKSVKGWGRLLEMRTS
jgi:maleate isomerase